MALGLENLAPLAIFLVIAGIVLSVGSDILIQVRAGQTASTYAYNATTYGMQGLGKVADWQPTIES